MSRWSLVDSRSIGGKTVGGSEVVGLVVGSLLAVAGLVIHPVRNL